MEAPGEKLLARLWETLADKGIGSLLRPWQMRREGRANIDVRAEEIVRLARAQAEAQAILLEHPRILPDAIPNAAHLLPPPPRNPEQVSQSQIPEEPKRLLLQAVSASTLAEATRREVNVAKAILFAEDELRAQVPGDADEAAPIKEPEKPEADWLFRWRDAASEVSAEQMQHLWGRVLAGEIKNPGSFSLRTLEFLRNISKQEAESINALSRYVLVDIIFNGDPDLLAREGLSLAFMLSLQDLGLVSGVGGLGLTATLESVLPDSFQRLFVVGRRLLLVKHLDATRKITLPVYIVTQLGREICKLGAERPSEPYLEAIGHSLVAQGYDVTLADCFPLSDGRFRYFNQRALKSVPPAT